MIFELSRDVMSSFVLFMLLVREPDGSAISYLTVDVLSLGLLSTDPGPVEWDYGSWRRAEASTDGDPATL